MRRVVVLIFIFIFSGFAKGWVPPHIQNVQNIIREANLLEQKLKDGTLEKECRQKIRQQCKDYGSMKWMCKKMKRFFGRHGGFQAYKQSIRKYVDCVHKAVRRHDVPRGVLECRRHRPELDCTKWMKRGKYKWHRHW